MKFLNKEDINKKSKEFYNHEKLRWRNNFHFEAPFGLINDPNGLCQYNGEYYIFFQWNPYSCEHKYKHWGYVKTKDFKNFSIPKMAIAPEEYYDKNGCYSGGAFIKDGEINLFYTGNVKGDLGERISYQCMAKVEDGEVRKFGTVIDKLPKGYTAHFRDPYIFEEDNKYYMILGIQREDLKGRAIIYKSDNLEKWELKGELKTNYDDFGFMWECPSLFNLNGTDVLIFSPQGLKSEEFKYQNLYQSGYIFGNLNYETLELENHSEFKELDKGFDFYAPQVFKDEKYRTLMIGWMGVPEGEEYHKSKDDGWIHSLTMPRELTFKEGVIYQNPIKEIESLRGEKLVNKKDLITKSMELDEIKENSYELKLEFNPLEYSKFQLKFMQSEEENISLTYDSKEEVCVIDRSLMKYGAKDKRKFKIGCKNGSLKINMFVDKSAIEIYFNDGEEVASIRAYPEKNSFGVSLSSEREIIIKSLEVWNMNEVSYCE